MDICCLTSHTHTHSYTQTYMLKTLPGNAVRGLCLLLYIRFKNIFINLKIMYYTTFLVWRILRVEQMRDFDYFLVVHVNSL